MVGANIQKGSKLVVDFKKQNTNHQDTSNPLDQKEKLVVVRNPWGGAIDWQVGKFWAYHIKFNKIYMMWLFHRNNRHMDY